MEDRNGYFQVIVKDNSTYLKLFPAKGAGRQVRIEDVLAYFLRNHIQGYKMLSVNDAIKNMQDTATEVFLFDRQELPISESVDVKISTDRMQATCVFFPQSSNGNATDKNNIIDDLNRAGVTFGIDVAVIDGFLKDREYCREFVIARGKELREGNDAVITYHFNTKPNLRPTENEDGTVDFHQLNFVSNVKAGDVLVTRVPADLGEHGTDVTGKDIAPRKVNDFRIQAGKNTVLEEDGKILRATVNGHAILDTGGKVSVSDVLEIKGDVDASTGDINYEGSVIVRGNVNTGYRIEATGNVDVDGVVEGATIIAGGNIALRRGVQGMNRAFLKCKGSLMTKFIENANVVVDGIIETGSILHSDVVSKKEIYVRGRKGLLVGGTVRAGVLIEAQSIGSYMGSNTKVAVGVDAETQDRLKNLAEELKKLQAEEYRVRQLLELLQAKQKQGTLAKEHLSALPKTIEHYTELKDRIQVIDDEIVENSVAIRDVDNARIKVHDTIYPGVTLAIAGDFIVTKDEDKYCQFVRKNGEITRALM